MPRVTLDGFATTPVASGTRLRLGCRVSGPGLPETLWVEVASRDADLLSDLGDWAAVAMLYPAMRINADLHLEAALSPRLLESLNHDFQAFLLIFDPVLRPISVTCAAEYAHDRSAPLVATGFSAGVDSFATLARYLFAPVHASLAVSAVVVFDVGAFGKQSEPFFSQAVSRSEEFAAAHGLRAIALASNLDAIYRAPAVGKPGFEKTSTFRNAAAALALEQGIGRYYVSSSFAPAEIGVRPTYNPAYLDPILLPLLSTERLSFVSACAGLSRVEKTRLVAALDEALPLLDVCTRVWERGPGKPLNCSHCRKCIRTLFTLEAVGRLEAFADVFDGKRFLAHRSRFFSALLERAAGGDSLDAEVVALLGIDATPARPNAGLLGRLRRLVGR